MCLYSYSFSPDNNSLELFLDVSISNLGTFTGVLAWFFLFDLFNVLTLGCASQQVFWIFWLATLLYT